VSIHAVGQTVAVTCPSCLCIIDATDENYRILNAAQKKTTLTLLLPLGQKGTLFGNTYEVVGFMQRCDETGYYRWHEYLLFNPFQGYRWLVMYQGHWNFYTMVKDRPTIEAQRGPSSVVLQCSEAPKSTPLTSIPTKSCRIAPATHGSIDPGKGCGQGGAWSSRCHESPTLRRLRSRGCLP